MITESLLENLSIYHDNLSVYYLGSVLVTVLSVILTWWYHRYYCTDISVSSNKEKDAELNSGCEPLLDEDDDRQANKNQEIENNITNINYKKKANLVEKVAASLTEEQLREEREVERQQLAAIFQLLQNQEDKFQVSSLEELEDQLRLYRN